MGFSRLRELRDLAGESLIDAAQVIRVSPTTIHNAERGYRALTPGHVERLEVFYFDRIAERLKRIGKLLTN